MMFALKLLVPAAALFILLNFFYVPSCGRFSCSYEPAWPPRAQAGSSDGCPDAIHGAMNDGQWAADRYSEIKDERDTTGVFYDQDGVRQTFASGDEKGADAELARKVLREVGARADRSDGFPAATHVEVKVAALMRERGVTAGVLVINHVGGPCTGTAGFACSEVLSLIVPPGSTLRVWFKALDGSGMQYQDYP